MMYIYTEHQFLRLERTASLVADRYEWSSSRLQGSVRNIGGLPPLRQGTKRNGAGALFRLLLR